VAGLFAPGLLIARLLVAGLFTPGLLVLVPRLFMARFVVHRLCVVRFGVLRLLLALRLELVDAALSFDHGRIDVRRGLLAPSVAVAIAATAAAPSAPLLVAVTLGTRILGTRIAGVRACVLDWRRLDVAFSERLWRLLRTGLLPLLMRRALALRPAVRARTTIRARTAIIPLPVALSVVSLSVAWTSIPRRLAVAALL
jgi:hypothetical protein